MNLFKTIPVTSKYLLLEALIVLLFIFPFSFYAQMRTRNLIDTNAKLAIEQIEEHLRDSLDGPLWNFSTQEADEVLGSFQASEYFYSATLLDSEGKVFVEKQRTKPPTLLFTRPSAKVKKSNFLTTQLIEKSIPIQHKGEKIGTLQLTVDLSSSIQQKKQALIETYLLTAGILIGLLLSSYLLTKRVILDRLFFLKLQFKSLLELRLEHPFSWPKGDEIDELGQSLEQTRIALKKAFDDLNQLAEQRSLQVIESSKLAALGEMAAGVAHEINNPLSIIIGKSELGMAKIKKEGELTKDYTHELLDKIKSTALRISKIIKGLKTFSRNAESDPMEPTPLRTIIEDSLELCHERFKTNGIDLKLNYETDLVINCRAAQISQTILNLLNNAYDAVENLPEKWVSLELVTGKPNLTILILVTDSGSGIPAQVAEKIMRPFFTTKPVGKGTGLGLSVSRSIIETHGGSLRIDSTCPNTRFIIELPVQDQCDQKAA